MLTLHVMVCMIEKKITKMESMFNKLSENIYFIGVSVDSLHTISVETQIPTVLPCNLKSR